MLSSLLRLIAIVASLAILVSFALFAIDEAKSGSQTQLEKLGEKQSKQPAPVNESARERAHGDIREAIDDADDILLSPFTGLIESSSAWVSRGVPTLIGLFVYGFLLSLLANYAKGLGRRGPRSPASG